MVPAVDRFPLGLIGGTVTAGIYLGLIAWAGVEIIAPLTVVILGVLIISPIHATDQEESA